MNLSEHRGQITRLMGVDGFGKFLRTKAPGVFKACTLQQLKGKRVAIDMHHHVYKVFFRNQANEQRAQLDVADMCDTIRRIDVAPVFVFDGDTRGLKERAHAQRKEQQARNVEALIKKNQALFADATPASVVVAAVSAGEAFRDDTGSVIDRTALSTLQPSRALFTQIEELLAARFGAAAVVRAADDAERLIARLVMQGEADYAASADYDTLFFGSPVMLIDFPHSTKMTTLALEEVRAALGFATQDAFVDFGILCGCDMTGKVPKIGPVRADAVIKKYGSIDAALTKELLPRLAKAGVDPATFDYVFARSRFHQNSSDIDAGVPAFPGVADGAAATAPLATTACIVEEDNDDNDNGSAPLEALQTEVDSMFLAELAALGNLEEPASGARVAEEIGLNDTAAARPTAEEVETITEPTAEEQPTADVVGEEAATASESEIACLSSPCKTVMSPCKKQRT